MRTEQETVFKDLRSIRSHSSAFGQFNWTPIGHENQLTISAPSERYLHSCAALHGKLYVLGGANNQGPIKESKLHVADLPLDRWSTIEGCHMTEGRNGHACVVFHNEIYFFGGSRLSLPTSDLFKYSPVLNAWTTIESMGTIPAPRQIPLFLSVRDSSLLVYGGIDLSIEVIYEDAYLWRGEWMPILVKNNLSPRVGIAYALCGSRVFTFGGEGPSQDNSLVFDDLHELVVDEIIQQMHFKQVEVKGKRPLKRTGHCMAGLSKTLLLVYGGQTREKGGKSTALGDLWLFNLQELTWISLQCAEGPIPPRYSFASAVQSSQIFVFGGFDRQNNLLHTLNRIDYQQYSQPSATLCSGCLSSPETSALNGQCQLSISSGFWHSLAMQLTFPFKAIDLLLDAAVALGASELNIAPMKNRQQYDILSFSFDGKEQLSSHYFEQSNTDVHCVQMSDTLHFLLLGALRLGKTMLYVGANQHTRQVLLTSVDNKYAPNCEEHPTHLAYYESIEENIQASSFSKSSGIKEAVYRVLLTQLNEPYSILSRRQGHFILIMQLNVFPIIEKAYYYQLISYNRPEPDLKIYFNERKQALLDNIGISLSQTPQYSLNQYLRISQLIRPLIVRIDKGGPVNTQNYLCVLKHYERLDLVDALQCPASLKQLTEDCQVWRCKSDSWLDYNQGILIYCGNDLVDRFQCSFGELVHSKFFKKKYKKSDASNNMFEFVGVIFLPESLGLNMTKTRVRDRMAWSQIVQELTGWLKKSINKQKEVDLSALHDNRFSLSKEGSKRQKRE